MSGAVLAFVEHTSTEPDRLSLESLSLARQLATTLGVPLDAVVLGPARRPPLGGSGSTG